MTQDSNKTYSMAIASGKGGVGKTSIALNLAYALHDLGHSLILMDSDLGLANLDVMLGVNPGRNLQDLLSPEIQAEDVILELEPTGLHMLPSASGVADLVEMDEDVQDIILGKLNTIFNRYDYLVLDLGAGIGPTVLAFASMPQERIVVVTPEPTSLTDGYALIKVLSSKYGIRHFQVIVNMAEDEREARRTFNRLNAACEQFIGHGVTWLGLVRQDKNLPEAIRRQKPLLRMAPDCPASEDIRKIASRLDRQRQDLMHLIAKSPILKAPAL
ncbi:MAG: MinD/ParA family protein [Deltaproteobacteria bacterium]|nr:MinD/ParA family protein [Deltaproteobacteria bacterium]